MAVYRDKDGELQEGPRCARTWAASCNGIGGEKSWDCPCHGSRFSVDGAVLNGPAKAGLGETAGRVKARAEESPDQ